MTADSKFSIYVTIENPFDVPIEVGDVITFLPAGLEDVNAVRRMQYERHLEKQLRQVKHELYTEIDHELERRGSISGSVRSKLKSRENKPGFVRQVITLIMPISAVGLLPQVAKALSADKAYDEPTLREIEVPPRFVEDLLSRDDLTSKYIEAEVEQLINVCREKQSSSFIDSREDVLQPGNSATRAFTLRVSNLRFWLTPSVHDLQIDIRYSVGGKSNTECRPFRFVLHASSVLTFLSVVIGSLLATLVRQPLSDLWSPSTFGAFATSTILSIVAAIAVSKQKGPNAIISIGDFGGGLLLGFLIGYTGTSIFDQILKSSTTLP